MNESTTIGHKQRRGVRMGCVLSRLFFNLYVKIIFYHLKTRIEFDVEKHGVSLHDGLLKGVCRGADWRRSTHRGVSTHVDFSMKPLKAQN